MHNKIFTIFYPALQKILDPASPQTLNPDEIEKHAQINPQKMGITSHLNACCNNAKILKASFVTQIYLMYKRLFGTIIA